VKLSWKATATSSQGSRRAGAYGVGMVARRLTLLLAATICVLPAPAWAASAHAKKKARRVPPPPELLLSRALAAPGAPVTMPPVGLSLEYPVMAAQLGPGECPPPALAAELARLGSPPLQLAGQSQDFTVPAGSGPAPPQSWEDLTAYQLPAQFWSRLHCLLAATHEPLTVGLNVREGRLSWAEQIAAGASSAATNGLGFSLGNEPDLYYLPDYSALAKPQPGEEALDVGLYLQAASAMRPATGSAPLTGPELSGPTRWRASLPRVISTLGVRTVGIHVYPLSVCRTPRAATINGLLEPSVGDAPSRLGWVVADARAAGAQAVITEANSVSCGGKAGVSDSRASAVWAVRFVLSALKTGFAEVRFHFSGDPYDPFVVSGAEVVRRPIEAAIAAINQWLPSGASLHTVAGVRGFSVTAIVGAPGALPLLVIDNPVHRAQTLVLRGALAIHTQAFSATGAPPLVRPLKGPGHRVQAVLPGNSILTVAY
jgi:hypothetical protein